MTEKYHINPASGEVSKCSAQVGICPFGADDNHYSTKEGAAAAYEEQMRARHSFVGSVSPIANYWGVHVAESSIHASIESFRRLVGPEAEALEAAKEARDRGRHYHLTVVTPPEMKSVENLSSPPTHVVIEPIGIGFAEDGNNRAYFIVCTSEEIAQWREDNSLPPKDLHVTLGFQNKDVHTRPKGISSLVA